MSSVDIHEQERALEAAKKLKGEEKRAELRAIRKKVEAFLNECVRDFSVPFDAVKRAKRLFAEVDSSLARAKGDWAKIE